MYSVGLDVHTKCSSLCVLDPTGKVTLERQVRGPWPKLLETVAELPKPFTIAFEASCGYGHLHDQLTQHAAAVKVAHPGQLRLIFKSKRKNDRIDARKLAKLLHLDEIPQVHVPSINTRSWRKTIEFRQSLIRRRTAGKNRIRATLRSLGILAPKGEALWSKKGFAFLKDLPLPPGEKLSIDLELLELDTLKLQIATVEKHLSAIASKHPGVKLLMTVPGVGPRTAEAFLAYVDNPARFSRSNQFAAYFGLVPCQDASAGINRLGHITREGPSTVRKLLTEAAHMAVRYSPSLKARHERYMHNDPTRKKIAIVALARYLCTVLGAMLKTGEVWRGD